MTVVLSREGVRWAAGNNQEVYKNGNRLTLAAAD